MFWVSDGLRMQAAQQLKSAEGATEHVEAWLGDRVGRGDYELPVFPRVAQEVLSASSDDQKGPAAVARLIERDPALCGLVLAAANSAAFAGQVRIVSIKQAVARLGMSEVAMLATTLALKASVVKLGPYKGLLDRYWSFSLRCGLFAKEVARVRRARVDSVFLCGLLHTIGRPVVLSLLAKYSENHAMQEDAIRHAIDAHEASLGVAVVRSWDLSPAIEATILHHPCPAEAGEHREDVATVRLARGLARWVQVQTTNEERAQSMAQRICADEAVAVLSLYPDDLKAVFDRGASIAATSEAMA